jgi:hypothetical protein
MTRIRRYAGLIAASLLAAAPIANSADQPPQSPIPPGQRVLVLPADFRFMLAGAQRIEIMPAETAALSARLGRELERQLAAKTSMQFVPMPSLSESEGALTQEHLTLLRVAELNAIGDLKRKTHAEGSAPWRGESGRLDYSIGSGLAWLADRTGAEMAVLVNGLLFKNTVGRHFGTGERVIAFPAVFEPRDRMFDAVFIDLRSGDFVAIYLLEPGLFDKDGGEEAAAAAERWLATLFDSIPQEPFSTPPKRIHTPESKKRGEMIGNSFSVANPRGWVARPWAFGVQAYRRAYGMLEFIDVHSYKRTSSDALSPDFAKNGLEAIRDFRVDRGTRLRFKEIEVVDVRAAKVAGRDGFRAELTSMSDLGSLPFRMRHVIYGVNGPKKTHVLRFDAPAIYYFDHHLAEFDAMVATFKFSSTD